MSLNSEIRDYHNLITLCSTLKGRIFCIIKIKKLTFQSPYNKAYSPNVMSTYFTPDRLGLKRLSGNCGLSSHKMLNVHVPLVQSVN
jgi:hypothetical protein